MYNFCLFFSRHLILRATSDVNDAPCSRRMSERLLWNHGAPPWDDRACLHSKGPVPVHFRCCKRDLMYTERRSLTWGAHHVVLAVLFGSIVTLELPIFFIYFYFFSLFLNISSIYLQDPYADIPLLRLSLWILLGKNELFNPSVGIQTHAAFISFHLLSRQPTARWILSDSVVHLYQS